MDDLSGIGKSMNLKSGSTPLVCTMTGVSSNGASGWKCEVISCPHYGKWSF